jgi:glycine/serine hydroxymethyltransferase
MGEVDMKQLSEWIDRCLRSPEDEAVIGEIRDAVEIFCKKFPVPGI